MFPCGTYTPHHCPTVAASRRSCRLHAEALLQSLHCPLGVFTICTAGGAVGTMFRHFRCAFLQTRLLLPATHACITHMNATLAIVLHYRSPKCLALCRPYPARSRDSPGIASEYTDEGCTAGGGGELVFGTSSVTSTDSASQCVPLIEPWSLGRQTALSSKQRAVTVMPAAHDSDGCHQPRVHAGARKRPPRLDLYLV